jgi:hypothetical protein
VVKIYSIRSVPINGVALHEREDENSGKGNDIVIRGIWISKTDANLPPRKRHASIRIKSSPEDRVAIPRMDIYLWFRVV